MDCAVALAFAPARSGSVMPIVVVDAVVSVSRENFRTPSSCNWQAAWLRTATMRFPVSPFRGFRLGALAPFRVLPAKLMWWRAKKLVGGNHSGNAVSALPSSEYLRGQQRRKLVNQRISLVPKRFYSCFFIVLPLYIIYLCIRLRQTRPYRASGCLLVVACYNMNAFVCFIPASMRVFYILMLSWRGFLLASLRVMSGNAFEFQLLRKQLLMLLHLTNERKY